MPESNLPRLRIATPCHVAWDEMEGDGVVRHCSHCSLNVYNLSEMTSEEAEAVIGKNEGRVCVRLYRRKDGTIITRDCPVGRLALHRQLLALAGAIAAAIAVTGTAVLGSAGLLAGREWTAIPRPDIFRWWQPAPVAGPEMGDVSIAPPQVPQMPVNKGDEDADAGDALVAE